MDPTKSKTSMIHFSEAHFEKNLTALKNTQESIQSLSTWCLQHKQHHKKIVNCWFKVMKKVKMENRLTLFYLANDVIQYSKRKNLEFVQTWALFLQRAVTLVRDDKIKPNIQRIFKIWNDRGVFDEAFIADLTGLLESPKGVSSDTAKLIAEFQPMKLIDKIRSCKALEDDTDLKLSNLKKSALELTDADALRNNLKDRRHGSDHVTEVEEGIVKMEAYVASLQEEIKDRGKLIDFLEQGSVFYEHQKGEAKIVVTAYRNFGTRLKNLKRKLDEMMPTLPSPVPSPDIDAPSPSPDSDTELQLPGDPVPAPAPVPVPVPAVVTQPYEVTAFMQGANSALGMGSFMGSGSLPFDIQANLFQDSNTSNDAFKKKLPSDKPSEGKPIEVISSRSKVTDEFNISEFLKSLHQPPEVPEEPPGPSIPGLEIGMTPDPTALLSHPKTPQSKHTPSSVQYPSAEGFGSSLYSMFTTPPPPPPVNMVNSTSSPVLPLQPPPAPPDMFLTDSSHEQQWAEEYGGMEDASSAPWNTKLPPKFPTWGDPNPNWEEDSPKDWEVETPQKIPKLMDDTPMSPPMFEKEGFNEPVQYDDTVGSIAEDVDHRTVLSGGRGNGKKDVDHRNLISLTGSPASHHKPQPSLQSNKSNWSKDLDFRVLGPQAQHTKKAEVLSNADQDYRQLKSAPEAQPNTQEKGCADNVESVDMEMSDEEADSGDLKQRGESNHSKKNSNAALSQDKNKLQKTSTTPQSNGPHRNPPTNPPHQSQGPRPLLSGIRPQTTTPIPPLMPVTPIAASAATSKIALLPNPNIPALKSPVKPDISSDVSRGEVLPEHSENKNGGKWAAMDKEWNNPSEQKRHNNSLEEESFQPSHQRPHGTSISPRGRGMMGNQVNVRGKPMYRGDFSSRSGYANSSPGYSGRGYRGSYRPPFRGPRRGQFTRW